MFRARTIVYPLILLCLMTGLVFAISTKTGFDSRIIRQTGAPFTLLPSLKVSNQFRLRLVNRTDETQSYSLSAEPDLGLGFEVMDPDKMTMDAGKSQLVPINITFDASLTRGSGRKEVTVTVKDSSDNQRELDFYLLGPR